MNQEKALSSSEACLGKRTCRQPSAHRIAPPPQPLSPPRCLAGRSALRSPGPRPLPPLRLSASPPPAAAAAAAPVVLATAQQVARLSAPLHVALPAQLACLRSTRTTVEVSSRPTSKRKYGSSRTSAPADGCAEAIAGTEPKPPCRLPVGLYSPADPTANCYISTFVSRAYLGKW